MAKQSSTLCIRNTILQVESIHAHNSTLPTLNYKYTGKSKKCQGLTGRIGPTGRFSGRLGIEFGRKAGGATPLGIDCI